MAEWIPPVDLYHDKVLVEAIKAASLDRLKRAHYLNPAAIPIAYVVSHRQFDAMKRSMGVHEFDVPSGTLYGVQVLVAADGWPCPSNLTDLRKVSDAEGS